MKVQINCPHHQVVMFNGKPYNGCLGLKELINSDNIHQLCGGDKCPLPIINKQEAGQ